GRAGNDLAGAMCDFLEIPLGQGRTESFPDGELLVKVDEDVRGRDCFVVQSTSEPINANLMELLIYIDCLRRASAKRITAVIPYFGYARQDRKDEGRVPITAKLVANLIAAAGADRVLCMDLHAAQIQGFFDIPVDHLTAAPVLVEYFDSHRAEWGDLAVVSPDVGNVKVANMYADHLHAELAIIDKRRRSSLNVELAIIDKRRRSSLNVATLSVVGDVSGRTVVMIDDMISTGGTLCEAASIVMEHGAVDVICAATHPVLVGPAVERLAGAPISRIIITDTIPNQRRFEGIEDKLTRLTVGPLFGEAVHRIHHDMSISALFREAVETQR
ncbi:MAG: ribose-phosphate diphosphokinase, partial [Planctomycetota bacterium]